ncbi:AraC family transcriptional regulator [Chitinophaga arvensicola]|uniref:AraC-type DNA-binding protein n=1 Tax=Chitinophaga arvensicola TaxID=29529 RepID=A0A1I0S9R0_9BACT|nr:AraC family transcriptional regulator [Chitinophaga arvensicola]SEW53009.1 AraC-type DNA-binding protein [Chitinophaga arvensicola]
MINYYKYLPVSREDESWGLWVLNAGCTHVAATGTYPVKHHPAHYHFNWKAGRVLNEYQVIYITSGKGIFESDRCRQQEIKAGTVILLFPGERHRYRPLPETGWDEYWVGMKGPILDNLLQENFFTPEKPCLTIGFQESIVQLFHLIIEKTKQENPGYQPLIAGATLQLMGNIHYLVKQQTSGNKDKEALMNQARLLFRSNISAHYSPEQAAEDLQVGYSWFRKEFKKYTGLSPFQYYIQLKIEKARELLNDPSVSVKEIAYDLRFDSSFYFSRLFKEKTGFTPTEYRKRTQGEI